MTDKQEIRRWAKSVAPKIAEVDQGSKWDEADLLVRELPEDEWGVEPKKGATQSPRSEELDERLYWLAKELDNQHAVIRRPRTLAGIRATAIRWPEDQRNPRASFTVHYRLRSDDRYEQMARYQKKADEEGLALTQTRLSLYKQEDAPLREPPPLTEAAYRRLTTLLKRLILGPGRVDDRDDWWNNPNATEESRQIVANILQRLADEIAP